LRPAKSLDLVQFERDFLVLQQRGVVDDAVLDPLQRVVLGREDAFTGLSGMQQADLVEIFLQVAPRRQVVRNLAEDQEAVALGQHVLDLFQQVRGGDVDGLDAAHVEDQEVARP
jgi:hypothetical protein